MNILFKNLFELFLLNLNKKIKSNNMKVEIKSGNGEGNSINSYINKIAGLILEHKKSMNLVDNESKSIKLNLDNTFEIILFAKQKNTNKLVSIVEILKRKLNVIVKYDINNYKESNSTEFSSSFVLNAILILNLKNNLYLKDQEKEISELLTCNTINKNSKNKNDVDNKDSKNLDLNKTDTLLSNIDLF